MNTRDLSRGVMKLKAAILKSPNPDLKTVLNGYSMRDRVTVLTTFLMAGPLNERRALAYAVEGKQ